MRNRWLFSIAFITGYIPSLLILFAWAILVFLLLTSFWGKFAPREQRRQQQQQHLGEVSGVAATLNPLSTAALPPRGEAELSGLKVPRGEGPLACTGVTPADVASSAAAAAASSRSDRINTLRMWSMFLANVLIVGSVNGLYIFSTLQSYSVESRILIQYAGACCLCTTHTATLCCAATSVSHLCVTEC